MPKRWFLGRLTVYIAMASCVLSILTAVVNGFFGKWDGMTCSSIVEHSLNCLCFLISVVYVGKGHKERLALKATDHEYSANDTTVP